MTSKHEHVDERSAPEVASPTGKDPGATAPAGPGGDEARSGDAEPAGAEETEPRGEAKAGASKRLQNLRHQVVAEATAGAHTAVTMGEAAAAVRLDATATGLSGARAFVGHVLGLHQMLRASGLHGPRQIPAVVYLFADAVAVRPSDDAPMSTVPLLGLHMVFPPLAVTRWLYKAGRTEHANVDLIEVASAFEAALPQWTVDDFADADPKLDVRRLDSIGGPVHVYERLGFAHLWVPADGAEPLRLQSTLPATPEAFAKLWQLCGAVSWPGGIQMVPPPHEGHSEA